MLADVSVRSGDVQSQLESRVRASLPNSALEGIVAIDLVPAAGLQAL